MIFRRRNREPDAGAAVADAPETAEGLLERIDELGRANRAARDPEVERRIVRLRHRAGALLLGEGAAPGERAAATAGLTNGAPLPEVSADRLTPELARAAIEGRGALLVRGLIDRDEAARLAGEIERAFEAREARGDRAAMPDPDAYFEHFKADPPFEIAGRGFVQDAGGMWGADSPRVLFDFLETFQRAGLRPLIESYLGGGPLISVDKCTLRRVRPETFGAWHQDGAFLGDVTALNIWVTLSRCGDVAPGLDVVPRRIDHIVPTGTEGSFFDWDVAADVAREAAGDVEIIRPVFEPGDAMLFDDLFLHSTATSPQMTETRYAIETWFFAPAGFPSDYVPLAL